MTRLLRLIILVLCANLSACALTAPEVSVGNALAPEPESFLMRGRVAVADGTRAANASLEWRHHAGTDRLEFLSPLGQVVGRLSFGATGVVLETQDGRSYRGASASELVAQHLGMTLPLDVLGHWLFARAPDGRVLQRNAAGLPERLSDQGWLIDYPEYRDSPHGALPRRIAGSWGEVRFSLVVDEWEWD